VVKLENGGNEEENLFEGA